MLTTNCLDTLPRHTNDPRYVYAWWALLQSEKDPDVDIIYKHIDTVMDAGEGVLEREEQAGKWLLASAYNEHDGVIMYTTITCLPK